MCHRWPKCWLASELTRVYNRPLDSGVQVWNWYFWEPPICPLFCPLIFWKSISLSGRPPETMMSESVRCERMIWAVTQRAGASICVLFVFTEGTEADESRMNHSAHVGEVNVNENKNRIVLCVCVQKILHTSSISCSSRDKQSGRVKPLYCYCTRTRFSFI